MSNDHNPPPPFPLGNGSSNTTASNAGLSAIFDLSFTRFVTPSIIKIFFIFGLALISIASLSLFIFLLQAGGFGVVLAFVLTPIYWLIGAILVRIYAEIVILAFKLQAHLENIEANTAK